MEVARVKEILEFRKPTEVPLMPDFMRGVINLRGHVVPVVDLAVRLGRQAIVPGRRTCIVIVEVPEADASHDLGVVVDAVKAVQEIRSDSIEPAPSFGTRVRTDFIRGLAKGGEGLLVILDLARVLSLAELAALVAAPAAPPDNRAPVREG